MQLPLTESEAVEARSAEIDILGLFGSDDEVELLEERHAEPAEASPQVALQTSCDGEPFFSELGSGTPSGSQQDGLHRYLTIYNNAD